MTGDGNLQNLEASNCYKEEVTPSFEMEPPLKCRKLAGNSSISTIPDSNRRSFQVPIMNKLIVKNPGSISSINDLVKGLDFPDKTEVTGSVTPLRTTEIPITFNDTSHYKQVYKQALNEHLNILLFEISQRYHTTCAKTEFLFGRGNEGLAMSSNTSDNPSCKHGSSVIRAVKKEGKNKGRLFFCCPNTGNDKCNFFKWEDEASSSKNTTSSTPLQSAASKTVLKNANSAHLFFKAHGIHFYGDSKLVWKTPFFKKKRSFGNGSFEGTQKKSMYLSLPLKEASSVYGKQDLWIISKYPHFPRGSTFIAQSLFYGPNSQCEVEIKPLDGFSMSNWSKNEQVYALLAGNASTELTCICNLEMFFDVNLLPVSSYLISCQRNPVGNLNRPLTLCRSAPSCNAADELLQELVESTISTFTLNDDQSLALKQVANMFSSSNHTEPVALIHGVFGVGKSYLLSTMVLFLVQLFEKMNQTEPPQKVLIASTTNVAVDRVLQGLLDLGFDDFIRVGSVKKIACPILPFSVHASEKEDEELKELNDMLASDLTSFERGYVRKAIEKHKLGANRKKLSDVHVVGVTCAASVFPCMEKLTFQIQLLDECSQMMEPLSMLPIGRFRCEKLVLVGDPKQLSPTIQGSEPAHDSGLEMTMFERLQRAGCQQVMLRTQYRCHPTISNISNQMFYNGELWDGISIDQRQQLYEWLPTLAVLNCSGGTEVSDASGSFYNIKEAQFVVLLLKCLLLHGTEPSQIGIITQYRSQTSRISTLLTDVSANLPDSELKSVRISTVDAFQGAEKDIIILSCVRTKNAGFIDCPRRTNVALTRAKKHLIVVGNTRLLSNNKLWRQVISICQQGNGLLDTTDSFSHKLKSLEDLD